MKSRQIYVLSFCAMMSVSLTGCSDDPSADPSIDTLASAIRAVGYPCASVVDSNEFSNGQWRVACEGTFTYAANLSDDRSICIMPIPYTDSVGPAPMPAIEDQCIAAGDI